MGILGGVLAMTGLSAVGCKRGDVCCARPLPEYSPPYTADYALSRLLESECGRVPEGVTLVEPWLHGWVEDDGPVVALKLKVMFASSSLGVTYFASTAIGLMPDTGAVEDEEKCARALAAEVELIKRVARTAESLEQVKRFVAECQPGTVQASLVTSHRIYYSGVNADGTPKHLNLDLELE